MISVLIPFRNAAPWLSECIESLRAQTYTQWEALLMDDHSDDDSREIINKFIDNRIHVVSVQGKGIVAALNEGLFLCRYPLIARMDADDRMPIDRLELQLKAMISNPSLGLVSGQVELFSEIPDSRGYQRYVDWINSLNSLESIQCHRFIDSPFAHPSVMFRKILVNQFGAYRDGPFPEDYELWLRWLESGVQMKRLPETVLYWRDHDSRLSRTHARYSPEAFRILKAQYLAHWLTKKGISSVWYWGEGKIARAQRKLLEELGISTAGSVEVDSKKLKPGVVHYESLGVPQGRFLISLVGNVGARIEIKHFLESRNWKLGQDFILAS